MQASRRQALGLGLGAVSSWALSGPASALVSDDMDLSPLLFRVLRNGSDIGRFAVEFSEKGEEFEARTEIEARLGFAFVTVWRYRHRSVERWRRGALIDIACVTESNGRRREVRSEPDPDGLRIIGTRERVSVVPPDTLTSNCQWHPGFVGQREIVDTHSGITMDIASHPDRADAAARRYRVYVPKFPKFAFVLQYDRSGRWTGGQALGDGERILFEPV